MMHKPWHSLVFAVSVFAALSLIGEFFPPGGLVLGKDLLVDFPSPGQLLKPVPERATVTAALEAINRTDTTFRIDRPEESVDTSAIPVSPPARLVTDLQYDSPDAMKDFYDAITALERNPSQVRVLHYGDSQIEGDRITDYLRLKLQAQFGGSGPGLISFMPLTSSPTHRIVHSGSWERYSAYVAKDKRVASNDYGVRASFCRFKPFDGPLSVTSAGLKVITSPKASGSVADNSRIRIFYGGARSRTWCEYYDGPALVAADSLEAGGNFKYRDYPVINGSAEQEFRFAGTDSPDFYALSLEGDQGVQVDNIAMRGSSGTFFHVVDRTQMKKFYEFLNVRLVILQFGGNTLAAIEDTAQARKYADYMRHQVSLLRKIAPSASILFVGPADMSVKIGTSYETHPLLEAMRDNLKRRMLEAGCAFFDMYDAMGGRNSMPVWVEENLAGNDYTHFSPKGARKIATVLYAALINDYNSYLRSTVQ